MCQLQKHFIAVAALLIIAAFPQESESQTVNYINASQCFGGAWAGGGNTTAFDVDGDLHKDILISTFDFNDTTPEASGTAWKWIDMVGDTPWFQRRDDWYMNGRPVDDTFGFLYADYDNDGRLDVFCPHPDGGVLLENRSETGGRLRNVTSNSTDLFTYRRTIGATWADVNADTYVDLVILQYTGPNETSWTEHRSDMQRILINVPNPAYFEGADLPKRIFDEPDVPLIIGAPGIGGVLSADFNQDHDVDLIFMQAYPDGTYNPRYLDNTNGAFENQSTKLASVESNWDAWRASGMVVDVDNNGTLDIYYSSDTRIGYVLNDGTGMMSPGFHGWHNLNLPGTDIGVMDFNLDGRFDLVKTSDNSYGRPVVYSNTLAGGNIVLNEISAAIGLGTLSPTYGVCLTDLTDDGLTEVLYCRTANASANFQYVPSFVTGSNHWIGVDLRSLGGLENRYCIGATVTVDDGTVTRTRIVDGGSGRASQQDFSLVFGLGGYGDPVNVTVSLPSGRTRVFTELAPDQYHSLNTEDHLVNGSVNLTVEYDLGSQAEDWTIEWITNDESDQSRDGVTFTIQGDPFESSHGGVLPNPLTLTGATTVEDLGDGRFKHSYTLNDIVCSAGRIVTCTVDSWLGDFKASGQDNHKTYICLQQL